MTMVNKRQPIKTELYQRLIVHWKSTLVGIFTGCVDFFVDVVHGVAGHVVQLVDPTALDWHELRVRVLKAAVISIIISLGRFNWKHDPTVAVRRADDVNPTPPREDQK